MRPAPSSPTTPHCSGTGSSATASRRPGTHTGRGARPPGCTWTKFHKSSSTRARDCPVRRRIELNMGRWDHILDRKPQELREYVLDKVAEQLALDVRNFPPRIEEWLDESLEARYASVLSRVGRPELDTYRVACELAREEMLREYELIDRFCRSEQYRRLLPDPLEEQTAHFLTRYLVDSALQFQESAQGKFSRRDLVALMEKVEDRLLRGYRLRL